MSLDAQSLGIERILILGSGLMGTSIALALKEQDLDVWLEDIDDEVVAVAIARGAGTQYETSMGEPDLVIVAVPPSAVALAVVSALDRFPSATVTDVASIKELPTKAVASSSQVDAKKRYIGSHPMAGREFTGAFSAKHDLFIDRTWVIMESPDASELALQRVEWLIAACGAVSLTSNPQDHDRAVALTSHAPQLLASIMASQLRGVDPDDLQISGQGLRDVTRLAASDADLWVDIVSGNAQQIRPVLESIHTDLGSLVSALERLSLEEDSDEAQVVRGTMVDGNEGHSVLPDKHGGAANSYGLVTVVVDDKPGELARLFATAGGAEVNLEDVRIEHTLGRLTATVELAVNFESVSMFEEVLAKEGWRVQREAQE